ncbi:MAG: hypothetical protein R2695_15165 [Acidimicrobiales bacterium]
MEETSGVPPSNFTVARSQLCSASGTRACADVVTGHGLRIATMHLRSLAESRSRRCCSRHHSLAAALLDYVADIELLRAGVREPTRRDRPSKSIVLGRWPTTDGPRFSWYEPIADAAARERGRLRRRSALNTSSDARLLRETLGRWRHRHATRRRRAARGLRRSGDHTALRRRKIR